MLGAFNINECEGIKVQGVERVVLEDRIHTVVRSPIGENVWSAIVSNQNWTALTHVGDR